MSGGRLNPSRITEAYCICGPLCIPGLGLCVSFGFTTGGPKQCGLLDRNGQSHIRLPLLLSFPIFLHTPLHFSSSLSFSEDGDFSSFLSLNRVTMPPVTQDRTVCGRTGSWWSHFKMTNATNMSNINSSILLDTRRTFCALNVSHAQLTQLGLILFGRTKVNNCIQCDGQQNVDKFQKSAD